MNRSSRGVVVIERAWSGLVLLLAGIVVALGACANPVPPTGGPKDTTPPSIVRTQPARDSVNVSTSTQSVRIQFSEYVERSTVGPSLTITPPVDGRIRYDWSGRDLTVELPESLRDSTTYLLTFGTGLTDAHGVSLDAPITVAFATGPQIDQGELKGRVVTPRRATPAARVNVFAYALPSDSARPPAQLPERPDYRTQTGSDGTFAFDYLREQPYYVVALRDNNRNRQPDPTEAFAVPPRGAIAADSGSTPVPVPWLLTKVDTTAPTLRQVRPLSQQRLRVSFSEPIRLASRRPAAWSLRDSVADASVPVRAVYRPANRADAVVVRTAPMQPTRHALGLDSAVVTDTVGHALRPDTARFTAVDRADTTRTRFQSFVPAGGTPDTADLFSLLPGVHPGVRFNEAPDSSTLRTVLALRDTTGKERPYDLTTDDGRTYRLVPRTPLAPYTPVEVAVDVRSIAGPDTTYRRRVRRTPRRLLGALEGRAVRADTTHPAVGGAPIPVESSGRAAGDTTAGRAVIEVRPAGEDGPFTVRRQAVVPGSTFVFSKLPEGAFRFRAFLDRNGNGHWDGGTIQPFAPPEPITWSADATEARPRWTSVLDAPLRIPVLTSPADASPSPTPDTTATDTTEAGP